MKKIIYICVVTITLFFWLSDTCAQNVALVIHGGAGNVTEENVPDSVEVQYREVMHQALKTGYKILAGGGSAQEAVQSAIHIMEDSPLFNAGKGAVFTNAGTNELDAAVMDGATLKAGAVSGVRHIKNPIDAAICVMQKSPHVLLYGVGAETFAASHGITMVDTSYFFTQKRYDQLKKAQEREENGSGYNFIINHDFKFGTVGAVALDLHGNIFAGTSTGGMTNKRFGRIGDTPIIGAGTYANNNTCGISATGHGEYFMRAVVAHDISAIMEYKELDIQKAADMVMMEKLKKMGGEGGVVGLDAKGNIMMSFNSAGMFRGYIKKEDHSVVLIFKDR